ncbi:MAG: hypothetical protein COU11_01200 [Candidatus Harrisonbacteria bacterium CG10_big_fil_rev_8_21_14_0_10_49_15]|uniref:Uncharacterized protein n=1 Tax=Candidatus Harrisonbacteria bacterium CG10_big_fil_rev_8_21_14_0_10_49_15 TaxID=1974587 RepID=A0A2H0ULM8_9BACT|nr:MAG: hypothetical protein COU11_01200 [Candidatus Harrisonbacteria bacterium CG10_big_fil_rev_8_21_14_0_10_49_15]
MSRKFFIIVLFAGLLTSFTACGGGGGGTVAGDPPPSSPKVGFQIGNANQSEGELVLVWIKPTELGVWESYGRFYIPTAVGNTGHGFYPGEGDVFPELVVQEYIEDYGDGEIATLFDIRVEFADGGFIILPAQWLSIGVENRPILIATESASGEVSASWL